MACKNTKSNAHQSLIKKLLQKNIQLSYKLIRKISSKSDFAQESHYRSELKLFLESFKNSLQGKTILDVGSGSWPWIKQLFSPFSHVTTFDIVPDVNVDVVGDIYQLRNYFPTDSCFDAMIATDVFEHLAQLDKALHEISFLLRPGGILILSTPFNKNLHGEEYGDYWRITRQGWQQLLERTGFRDITISWVGEELFPKAYLVHAYKK